MEKLTAYDATAEVIGQAMLGFIECTNKDEIAPLLEAQGLTQIEPQKWYPLQPYLNVFKAIIDQRSGAMFNLVSVGTKVSEMALLPPEMNSIETAMRMVDIGYQINHRNGNVGKMTPNFVGPRTVEIIDSSCYPDDFMYGVLFGLARRFKAMNDDLVVRHEHSAACRKRGGESCTYRVTW
jgi:hypothetical protein